MELHTLVFFRKRKIIAEARVFKVRANGLVVFVPKFGIEGPVLFDGGGRADASDEDAMTVSHRGKSYKVFDRLTTRRWRLSNFPRTEVVSSSTWFQTTRLSVRSSSPANRV